MPRPTPLWLLAACLVVGCSEHPVLPEGKLPARAYAERIGTDSLRVTVANDYIRPIVFYRCTTRLQRRNGDNWVDVPGAGPAECIYGPEPTVASGSSRSVTIAYDFGSSEGPQRVVFDVERYGPAGRPTYLGDPTEQLASFELGVMP